jgi:arylsulfatase A-like enzyme
MRFYVQFLACSFVAFGISLADTRPTSAADLPNILWLTSEDHGPEMGCYGDALARTPNIDALARQGMIFNRAWSCAPVCAPARTTIISGMYPSSTGGIHMRSMVPMPQDAKMYPEYLRQAGYYCTNCSKEDYNLIKPANLWDDTSSRAHWKNRKPGQPFFAIFNSTKSHESQIRTRPHKQITDPSRVRLPHYHPDTPEVRQDWGQYYDKVSEADADAGERIRELTAAGLFEETIIFYYGDHGSGMPRSKRWPCNSGLHVPMVVYFPKKWQHLAPAEYQAGTRSDRLVNFVDLAPTLLSIVGVEPPKNMQGYPFAGSFQKEPQKYMFGMRGRMDERQDFVRSVTDGRYVYLRNFHPHVSQAQHVDYQFQTPTTRVWKELYDRKVTNAEQSVFWSVPKAVEELYDLQFDPFEVKNLAAVSDHQERLREFRRICFDQMAKVRDIAFLPEGEMHLRAQGRSPYDLARDEKAYDYAKIAKAAELASDYSYTDDALLLKNLSDSDSAVRYWGAMGFLIRGGNAIFAGKSALRMSLQDPSPFVRIVAAETLATYGTEEDIKSSLDILADLAPTSKSGVLVSMAALSAIEAVGKKAEPAYDKIHDMQTKGESPDDRYDGYVPRLLQNLSETFGGDSSGTKRNKKSKQK